VGSTVALTGVCAALFAGEHNGILLIILFNGIGVVFGRLPVCLDWKSNSFTYRPISRSIPKLQLPLNVGAVTVYKVPPLGEFRSVLSERFL
jgi:hypothetical protein